MDLLLTMLDSIADGAYDWEYPEPFGPEGSGTADLALRQLVVWSAEGAGEDHVSPDHPVWSALRMILPLDAADTALGLQIAAEAAAEALRIGASLEDGRQQAEFATVQDWMEEHRS